MALSQRVITRAVWCVFAAALVAAGFLCDGVTETGHHLFLILGGVAIGYGVAKDGTDTGTPIIARMRKAVIRVR